MSLWGSVVGVEDSLKSSGRALWDAVNASRDVSVEYVSLLLNACRIADRLDDLSIEMMTNSLVVENSRGDEIANPLISEHRMQLQTLRTVLASLGVDKLPAKADDGPSFEERLAEARRARLGGVEVDWG